MKNYITYFLLLCCFYAHADYNRYVDDLIVTEHGTESLVEIKLSDQTTWKTSISHHQDYLLYDLEKDLTPGREVYIISNRLTPEFLLCVDEDTHYHVSLTKKSKELMPTLAEIEEIQIDEGGWFTSPVYEYLIHLSDGSAWKADTDTFGTWNIELWKLGQKVMTSLNVNNEYVLINLDVPYKKKAFHQWSDFREISNVKAQ